MISGVYQIYNYISKKRYIGSSKNVVKRFTRHRGNLKSQYGSNREMELDYLKYGINSFVFGLIEECSVEMLETREQYYIDLYGIVNLYNKAPLSTSNKGTSVSWNRGKKGLQNAWNKGLKGWRPKGAGTTPRPFSVVSPDNILYEGIGVKNFAYEMGLTSGIYSLIKGDANVYKGWTLPKEDNGEYNGYGFWPNLKN